MRRIVFAFAALALAGCSGPQRTPAKAYRHFGDRVAVALGLAGVVMPWPCATTIDGFDASLPALDCYRFDPPRRMRGVWIDGFEGSRFLPGATAAPAGDPPPPRIWLDVETNRIAGLFQERHRPAARAMLVDFVGRQTSHAGAYGHMGMSAHQVIVERLIAAREIPLPAADPPQTPSHSSPAGSASAL